MKFYIVDCFAEHKYQGNQLAVFIPEKELTTETMQFIAREMNFNETTFILSGKQDNGGYDVRIFTPYVEVPFAGHPTLGTAFVIWKLVENRICDQVILNLKVGPITISIDEDVLTMKQNKPAFGEIVEKNVLAEILSISPDSMRDDYPIQWVSTGLPSYIIPLRDVEAIKRCRVNHERFQSFFLDHDKCNLLVFAPEGKNDLKVRVFLDDPGFLEDPATGSANGNLAGYLLRHNMFDNHKLQYTVNQGAEVGRPSSLRIEASLLEGSYTILVGGKAQLVAEGNWV